MYDFDTIQDRKNTGCIKHDLWKEVGKNKNTIPLWIADMDFQTAPEITQALIDRAQKGIFGYSMPDEQYYNAVINWYKRKFDYSINKEYILTSPGIVFALNNIIRALTNEGDSILIQRPVYYPFSNAINQNNRKLINNPLVYKGNKYSINFEDFEQKIVDNNVKLFILCSPHNPVCRVWTKEELTKIAEICIKHNVLIIADEIHADFIHKGTHTMFPTLSKEVENICITCTSPSKTFNIAGLQISNVLISNKEIREKVKKEFTRSGYGEPNVFGLIAVVAAYEKGEQWLQEMLTYIRSNFAKLNTYLEKNLPKIKMIEPQGTYLAWLDFSEYNFTEAKLEEVITNANLWLDAGTMFGPEGKNFQRINVACSWSILEKALENLAKALL